jgi:Fe2+ transport system protein B
MTEEQTRAFLDTALLNYKKRVSYGNISMKEQKRIETMFEVLYQEFGTPKVDDVSIVAENIETLKQVVTESNADVKTISNYAAWKHTVEKEEFERKQQMREQQTQRTIAAQNREKGRMLDSFEFALTDKQLDTLVKGCNDISMFTRDIEIFEMRDLLSCTHSEPLQVNTNKHLAVLFDKLRERQLICKTWMSVAERHNCFVSKQSKPVTSKDLSAALSTASLIKQDVEYKINACIDSMTGSD